jgi:hypothetical protein
VSDDHINYYAYNENWTINMFDYLITNGATPNTYTKLCAVEKYMKKGIRSKRLFDSLKNDLL